MTAKANKLPFKKTRTFKVLVLCVYVYSCAQLDPFDSSLMHHFESKVHAQDSQLEAVIADKLSRLILAVFDR